MISFVPNKIEEKRIEIDIMNSNPVVMPVCNRMVRGRTNESVSCCFCRKKEIIHLCGQIIDELRPVFLLG